MRKRMTKKEAEEIFLSGETFLIGAVRTFRPDWLDEFVAKHGKVCVVAEWGHGMTLTQEVCFRGDK